MNRIRVCMAPGEGDREQDLRIALASDQRFEPLQIDPNNTVDLLFELHNISWEDTPDGLLTVPRLNRHVLHIELKRPIDFVQSVLNGHLMDQTLSIRESGYNGCTVVLGTLDDIYEAIDKSNEKRLIDLPNGKKKFKFLNRDDRSNANASTLLRLKSFKKRSMLNGIPIFWRGDDSGFFDSDDQWKDILELANDYLTDGDMLGFRMRPANNEREVVAASMLTKGIGPETWRNILAEYQLQLLPRKDPAKPIEEIVGVGPKRAKVIGSLIRMVYR